MWIKKQKKIGGIINFDRCVSITHEARMQDNDPLSKKFFLYAVVGDKQRIILGVFPTEERCISVEENILKVYEDSMFTEPIQVPTECGSVVIPYPVVRNSIYEIPQE